MQSTFYNYLTRISLSFICILTSTISNASTHESWICPSLYFTQSVQVFNAVKICASADTPKQKILHAAKVTAAWLDNDLDGKADNIDVIHALNQHKATLVMTKNGLSDSQYQVHSVVTDKSMSLQDLHANETAPTHGRRDASQEEIHHLITSAGWMKVYPEQFAVDPAVQSTMYKQWQLADHKGYYDYRDPTCDNQCKAMEFHYLAAAAYLGASADLYSDEMKLKTRVALTSKLPKVIKLFESQQFQYPRYHWPDGTYPFTDVITQ